MNLPQSGNIESALVLEFCSGVVPGQPPISVPYEPLANKPLMECFAIVPEHMISHGGKQLTGWAIWESKHIIEAEYHAVWQDPEGRIIDLTPRPFDVGHITFLEDPSRKYTGRQVDNIRKALVNDFYVTQLLRLMKRRFEILNEGDLAYQHGAISLSPAAEREYLELEKEVQKLQLRLARK